MDSAGSSQATRRSAARVRDYFARELADTGMARKRESTWYRLRGPLIHVVRLRVTAERDRFQITSGIRVLNDPSATLALHGPDSQPDDVESLSFGVDARSQRECATECAAYIRRRVLPWFDQWTVDRILRDANPPFTERTRDALLDALAGRATEARVLRSLRLVGAPLDLVTATLRP